MPGSFGERKYRRALTRCCSRRAAGAPNAANEQKAKDALKREIIFMRAKSDLIVQTPAFEALLRVRNKCEWCREVSLEAGVDL